MKRKRQKRRGHYCWICGEQKSNEAFSGKGHRTHVCKTCSRLPKEERDAIQHEDEIDGFMDQSHISKKNMSRLTELAESPNPKVAELAALVLEVGQIKPYKKRRLKVLKQERPDLLEQLEQTGLIEAHHW